MQYKLQPKSAILSISIKYQKKIHLNSQIHIQMQIDKYAHYNLHPPILTFISLDLWRFLYTKAIRSDSLSKFIDSVIFSGGNKTLLSLCQF